MKAHSRLSKTLVVAALVILSAGFLGPLILAFGLSLQTMQEAYSDPPRWWPEVPQWSNYVSAFQRLPFARFLVNSTVISTASTAGAVLTSAMAGYAFARLPWRGKRLWYVMLLLALVVPAPILLVPRFLIFSSLGWVDTYKPLIVPAWLGGGAFNVLLFATFFRRMGRNLEDAGRMDGAGPWDLFWSIHLPAARPVVCMAAAMSFVYHWNSFLDPLLYLSDFQDFPVSIGLRMYQSLAGTWLPQLMAACLIALVPVAAVVLWLNREASRCTEEPQKWADKIDITARSQSSL